MSLILEALKKSETERRLGQVPGLMTPVQRTAPRRGSRWPLLVALLLAAALVAAMGWWWMQREVAPSAALDDARRAEAAPATPANPPPANDAVVATPAAAEPPASAPAPILPAELPSDPDFVSRERESRPVAANTPEPIDPDQPAPRALPQPVAPPAPRPGAQTPRATPTMPAATVQSPASAPASLTAPEATPTPPAAEETLEYLPRLVDLPAGERDALPPLKLTMHVYAADAVARFVVVDGQRMGQGERLSPTLTLTEIRRDGAVFESDGRRFLIPRL